MAREIDIKRGAEIIAALETLLEPRTITLLQMASNETPLGSRRKNILSGISALQYHLNHGRRMIEDLTPAGIEDLTAAFVKRGEEEGYPEAGPDPRVYPEAGPDPRLKKPIYL